MISFINTFTTANEEDHQKFVTLYEKYYNDMLFFAKSIVQSHALAEEVVQESYKRLFLNLQKVNDVNCRKTKGFLVSIVKHAALDCYNENLKRKHIDIDDCVERPNHAGEDSVGEWFNAKETAAEFVQFINRLSETERLLLRYKVLEQWSYKEIEATFGIKEATASSIVCRARKKLVFMYQQQNGGVLDK